MLKLEDTQFDILLKDRKIQIQNNIETIKQKKKLKQKQSKESSVDEAVPLSSIEDPFIQEMERSLRNGDSASVFKMMKKYENKKG